MSDARFKVYCSLVIQFVVIVHQSIGSFSIPPPPSPGLGILYFEDGFVQILPIKKKFCSNTHTNFLKAKSATVMLYSSKTFSSELFSHESGLFTLISLLYWTTNTCIPPTRPISSNSNFLPQPGKVQILYPPPSPWHGWWLSLYGKGGKGVVEASIWWMHQ